MHSRQENKCSWDWIGVGGRSKERIISAPATPLPILQAPQSWQETCNLQLHHCLWGIQEKGMATHSSIPAWRSPWTDGAWWSTVHGVTESEATEQVTLSLAGCIVYVTFVIIVFTLKEYMQLSKKYYSTEPQAVDFLERAEDTRKKINSWVKTQTKGKPKEIVSALLSR